MTMLDLTCLAEVFFSCFKLSFSLFISFSILFMRVDKSYRSWLFKCAFLYSALFLLLSWEYSDDVGGGEIREDFCSVGVEGYDGTEDCRILGKFVPMWAISCPPEPDYSYAKQLSRFCLGLACMRLPLRLWMLPRFCLIVKSLSTWTAPTPLWISSVYWSFLGVSWWSRSITLPPVTSPNLTANDGFGYCFNWTIDRFNDLASGFAIGNLGSDA